MAYYLKIKKNIRLLYPGDFFVGLDGINHTYNELDAMTIPDRTSIGVFEIDEASIDYEALYSPRKVLLRQLEELKTTKMMNQFFFRGDYYATSLRDMVTINLLSSIADQNKTTEIQDIGNLMWFNANVPFFWHTADGHIRNMDIPTMKDFAKSMAMYMMTCNVCATILKHRILNDEEVDIMDPSHWPDSVNKSIVDNYEFFSAQLVNAKYGDGSTIDDSYQSQLDAIASMIE